MRRVRAMACARFVAASVAVMSGAALGAPPAYAPVGSYSMGPFILFDAADAGAGGEAGLVYGLAGDGGIWRQDAVNSAAFTRVGAVDGALLSPFGPSFIRLSPDGSTIAIGDGNFGAGASVLLVSASSLNAGGNSAPITIAAANYDGLWLDGSTLLVSGGDAALGSIVTRIDTSALDARVVVGNIGGASGGLAFDGQQIYTGNSFDFAPGGSDTGEVRAFSLSAITAAASSGVAIDFEAVGRPVADALSASTLAMDGSGNLFVGGGDFFGGSGDFGYAAAIGAGAIQAALAGGPIAPDLEEQRVSPAGGGEFYGVAFNEATGEWLVSAGGVMYRHAIPAPATIALAAGASFLGMWRRSRAK